MYQMNLLFSNYSCSITKNSVVKDLLIIFSSTEFVFLPLMSTILHIETSTDICSVCLAREGEIISIKETDIERSHAGILTVFISEIMEESMQRRQKLDAIAVSMGPGSYTGLRIGVSVAKGICYGADLPLISVPTLEAMCIGALRKFSQDIEKNGLLIPMIDARRMEVYMAIYDTGMNLIEKTSATVINENTFLKHLGAHRIFLFGTGAVKLKNWFNHENICFLEDFKISSRYMVDIALQRFKLNRFEDVAYFEPYYLKDFIATTPKKNQLFRS